MDKVNTSDRLAELRKLMKERSIDVYSTMQAPPYKHCGPSLMPPLK